MVSCNTTASPCQATPRPNSPCLAQPRVATPSRAEPGIYQPSQTSERQSGGMIPSRIAAAIMPLCRKSARNTWQRRQSTRRQNERPQHMLRPLPLPCLTQPRLTGPRRTAPCPALPWLCLATWVLYQKRRFSAIGSVGAECMPEQRSQALDRDLCRQDVSHAKPPIKKAPRTHVCVACRGQRRCLGAGMKSDHLIALSPQNKTPTWTALPSTCGIIPDVRRKRKE